MALVIFVKQEREGTLRLQHQFLSLCLICSFVFSTYAEAAKVSVALATKPTACSFKFFDRHGKMVIHGKTPFIGMLSQGDYRLVIEHKHFYKESRTIHFVLGSQRVIQITLMPHHQSKKIKKTIKTNKIQNKIKKVKGKSPKKTILMPSEPQKRSVVARAINKKRANKKNKASVMSRIPWTSLVVGVGFSIAGGVFFIMSDGSFSDARNKENFQKDAYERYRDAMSQQSTGTFLLVAGGAAFVVTAFLYWHHPKKQKKPKRLPRSSPSPLLGQMSASFSF